MSSVPIPVIAANPVNFLPAGFPFAPFLIIFSPSLFISLMQALTHKCPKPATSREAAAVKRGVSSPSHIRMDAARLLTAR